MAATEYKILCSITHAYIAKILRRNPSLLLADRREIPKEERLNLIACELRNHVKENPHTNGFVFKDEYDRTIVLRYGD